MIEMDIRVGLDPHTQLQELFQLTEKILAEKTVPGLLKQIVAAACQLIGARIGAAGHSYENGRFVLNAFLYAEKAHTVTVLSNDQIQRGGVYMDLFDKVPSLRLTQEQLVDHPRWWGLPEGHVPLRGLLGARLVGEDGEPRGMIMISDKLEGDFTFADETILIQLAVLASLGMQHIEAREEAERQALANRRQADHWHMIFNTLTDAVIIYDREGQIINANPAASRIYGGEDLTHFDRAVLKEKLAIRDVHGRSIVDVADLPSSRALRGEIVVSEPIVLTNIKGQDVVMLISAIPLYEEGRIVQAVAVWRDVTERERLLKQIDTERRQAQRQADQWNVIFNSMADAVMFYDVRDNVTLINPAALRLCGIDPVGENRLELLRRFTLRHPDGFPVRHEELISSRALRGEHISNERFFFTNAQEEEFIVLVSASPVYEDRQIKGAVAVWHDVTEPERLLKQLDAERSRFRALLEAAPEGILETDREGRIIFANPAADRLYAQSIPYQQPLGAQTALELRYPDGRLYDARDLPLTRSALDGTVFHNQEMRVHGPEGQRRVLLANTAPILNARGERTGAVGVIQDISEIKQIQEDLKRYSENLEKRVAERTAELSSSEGRFRAVFEKARLGILLTDLGGRRILLSNPAFQQFSGYSHKELENLELGALFHSEDRNADSGWPMELLSSAHPHHTQEKRYLHRSGKILWTNTTVSLVQGTEIQSPFLLHLVEDITERRQIQAALLQAEQLTAAGKMAASLAHEINNPLQTVIGCLGLLEEVLAEQHQAQRYLKVAGDELLRASRIVKHLRDLNRKVQPGEKEIVDVNKVLDQVLLTIQKQCKQQGIEVLWKASSTRLIVQAVPDQLHQVFLNLLINAVEAMPEGGKLKVSARKIRPTQEICLIVQDSGPGIPEGYREQIFSPFFTTKAEGTGLGLFVSYNIIKEHGGRIEAESRTGKGTIFRVWLPIFEERVPLSVQP